MKVMKGFRVIFEIYKVQRTTLNFKLLYKCELSSFHQKYPHDKARSMHPLTHSLAQFTFIMYLYYMSASC